MAIGSVPVGTNAKTRPSRLFSSIPQFIRKSGGTMLRAYAMYRPFTVFFTLGMALFTAGLLPIFRFIYFFAIGDGNGHIQSMVLGAAMLILGALSWCLGILADLIAANRQLLEITLEKVRRLELEPTDALHETSHSTALNVEDKADKSPLAAPVAIDTEYVVGPNQFS
jgi:hypothetical protein